MEDTRSNTTSDCQSVAPNAQNGGSTRKRQKTSKTISTPNPPNDDDKVSTAAIRKQKNEDSCLLYKLSNDALKLIFGYVGKRQYRCVACASDRFHQVYLDTFGGEALTSFKSAVASVSCAAKCLDLEEELGCNSHAESIFKTAATQGKLDVLIWGVDSGYELNTILDEDTIVYAALNGHLEVVKCLRKLDLPIPWKVWTCTNAAKNGHLNLLKWARANQCP